MAQTVKHLPAIRETRVQSLGWEDPLEKENSNPLQYSCLENPMDRGAWWALVHGVAESRTRLSDFTFFLFPLKKFPIFTLASEENILLCAKLNKPEMKGQVSHGPTSVGYLEKSNSETESAIGMTTDCSETGQRESVLNGYSFSFAR